MEKSQSTNKQSKDIKFNNSSLRVAVNEWLNHESSAIKKYGHISQWDTSLVTNMSQLFLNANDFDSPIGNWDVSNVTTMHAMFDNAFEFNQDISSWDVSKVTDMSEMFSANEDKGLSFNQPIGNWDVSKVNNMSHMFYNAKFFNQPIGNWDVSNVKVMWGMFRYAKSFNQPIGNWDVSNVNDMSHMFSHAESFNQPIGNWYVSKVNNMKSMFIKAESFNQPIGNWDVSNVTTMHAMFCYAESFNQPIGNWDVSNVNDMSDMFSYAESFNQPIGNWDVSNVKDAISNSFDENSNSRIDFLDYTNKSSSKFQIVSDFLLDKKNKIILSNYKFNGANDVNVNPFTGEEIDDFIPIPFSSTSMFIINGVNLYVKILFISEDFEDESLPYNDYSEYFLGISEFDNFSEIEWYNYDENWDKGFDLIKILGLINVALSNEDFINDFNFFEYFDNFETVEINKEIDYVNLKKNWDEFISNY